MTKKEEWTGERLETFVFNESTIEHLHRYAIAKDYCAGKDVLDIASGEGYGANLLAENAAKVTGVDIDPDLIRKASAKYPRPNLSFIQGSIENIPFPDDSFDIVTCYETLEHVADHEKVSRELNRVVKPGGLIFISTPDKQNYSELGGYHNPFHKKELYIDEFKEWIAKNFRYSFYLYQRLSLTSAALLEDETRIIYYSGDYNRITTQEKIDPIYIIAIASNTAFDKPKSSLFAGYSILQTALNEKEHALKRTASYRIGHFILYPAKIIRKLLYKKALK